jgi:hypothetical protein
LFTAQPKASSINLKLEPTNSRKTSPSQISN